MGGGGDLILPLYTVALSLLMVNTIFKAIFSQKLKILIFFFLREREHVSKVQGSGRGTKRILSTLQAHREAQHRARFLVPEIMTKAEIKSRMLKQLSPPGAPKIEKCKKKKKTQTLRRDLLTLSNGNSQRG